MSELNLKQITDKLNTEFTGEVRKLVFWYDAGGEFAEDVDSLGLVNAKVLHLARDNQFYTKYFLECVDKRTNYLVYAPFGKPTLRENHLADTMRYSKEFVADRASLLIADLGLDERCKPVLQHYIETKFFAEKRRTKAFCDMELGNGTRRIIETALMSVLCKCKTPSFEEVLRTVLTESAFEENTYLAEFAKYDLLQAFWKQAEEVFGYTDETPTLEKLAMTLFVTYTDKVVPTELPTAWQPFITFKSGNVLAFLDNLMNSYLYGESFDRISARVYETLKGDEVFRKLPTEALVSCGIFAGIDRILIDWVTERLELEDTAAKLGDVTIPQLVKTRRQGHFGKNCRNAYFVLQNAWNLICGSKYEASADLQSFVQRYTRELYQMDRYYRYFCYYLDRANLDALQETSGGDPIEANRFEALKTLVENIYANDYLTKLCVNWNEIFSREAACLTIDKQAEFYTQNVTYAKDQLVIIISDALRYEVGKSLFEKLQADEKCTATMKAMASTLPSITSYGMAALLPHKSLELSEDYTVLVDGKRSDTLEQRQQILQGYHPASRCVQYDEIKNMSVAELRQVFTRQEVVYIYHNQIDARGDKLNTENEVFHACEEAIDEIAALIRRLTVSANRSHFFVTADHGFLYRRNKLTESDKIQPPKGAGSNRFGRRYLLTDAGVDAEGTVSVPLGTMFQNEDRRVVTCPMGADIFKAPGNGLNYVHGGSSPQEMLVPLIEVKTDRSFKETTTAQIALVSLTTKITNLITSLDFVQTEAVSDVVKETTYRIYFVDENGEKISNEHLYIADKKDENTANRVFRLRFNFKNKKYEKSQKYYLVACDESLGLEILRREIVMDIAFADEFDFGF